MSNTTLQVDLGAVETLIGSLRFTFVVSGEGDAHIQVSAANPSGAGGVMLMLDANGYEQLKAIVKGADGVIDKLIREGRIKRMVLPY